MLHKKHIDSHYHLIIPLLLMIFLTIGTIITVNQTQQIQKINSHAAISNCTVSSSKLTTKSQEQTLFGEINTYRIQNNVDHLIWNNTLKQSSEWLSIDMVAHNMLSHVDSLNRTPDIRLSNCGYDINNGYGENIAEGSTDPNAVFAAWKNDPPHNQILLNPKYNIAAISMETDSKGTAFWTMDFGISSSATNPTPNVSTFPTPTTNPTVSTIPTTISTAPTISNTPSISQNPEAPTPTKGPVSADMQIQVQIKINGIGDTGNLNPMHKTRKVTAFVYGTSVQDATTGTAFLTYDGSNYFTGIIHLGKLSQGPYFVKLVSDFTLQVLAKPEFQNLKINQINSIPPVTLYQGDMTADNILNIDDYNAVLPCFQSLKICPSANLIDFNDDGKTDVADYNLFLQSFEILHGN